MSSKSKKEHNVKVFTEDILPKLQETCNITMLEHSCLISKKGSYLLHEYFPKSDRLLVRNTNDWLSNGLKQLKDFYNIED